MQFILDDDIYKVARITGPSHNLLGIRLADSSREVNVVELPIKNGVPRRIDRDTVRAQVEAGLLEANAELGKAYAISDIFFVPSDTPSTSVYKFLTVELIKHVDCGNVFLVV